MNGSYLSEDQIRKFRSLLAKEKAISGQISGERLEDILLQILPNSTKKKLNIKDKKWFDLAQSDRGIEVKTFQINDNKIVPGVYLNNVLKRVPPNILPNSLTIADGNTRRVDRNANPGDVGNALIEYLMQSMREHAREKSIGGKFDFAILLRNVKLTQVGYWEMPIDFGRGSDYSWIWTSLSLKGKKNGKEIFSWYWANQRQLFYRFEAPQTVQVFDVPDIKCCVLEETELNKMLDESYTRGYMEGQKSNLK